MENANPKGPTHHPKFDPGCPVFQQRRDDFEQQRFSEPGVLDSCDQGAAAVYRSHHVRPFIQFVTKLTLEHHGSRQAAADFLEIDPGSLTVARRDGELGSRPLVEMLVTILTQAKLFHRLMENLSVVRRDMGRTAFIAAANEVSNRALKAAMAPVDVESYELLCRRVETCPPIASSGVSDDIEQYWLNALAFTWAITEQQGAPDLWAE